VTNGSQVLYGLKYATTAWPLGDDNPFHEELGYWLWDAETQEIIRKFNMSNCQAPIDPDLFGYNRTFSFRLPIRIYTYMHI